MRKLRHKDKVKMARKMLTTQERRGPKKTPIFLSKAWRERNRAIRFRLWKERNPGKWKSIAEAYDKFMKQLTPIKSVDHENAVGVNSPGEIQRQKHQLQFPLTLRQ